MRADYHLHCEFSDDSFEPMEKQVEQAIRIGLDEMCFTDHVDYGIKKDWSEGDIEWRDGDPYMNIPSMPLANVDYPQYFHKLSQMQKLYQGKIVIKQGLEFGVQTITVDKYQKLYETYQDQLDFILLSMHQINNKELWNQDFQTGLSQKEYNEAYYREIYEVQKVYKDYSVLAHLDLLNRYDLNGVYPFELVEEYIAEILKLAIRDNKGIELNTSSWKYHLKDTQPSRKILKLYKDLGGTILTVGSDAHTTEHLGDHLDAGYAILRDEIGFKEFCTFDKKIPIFHKL